MMEWRQEDGTKKLLMYYLQRSHKYDHFKKTFENHQDERNLLG
jgi:hypothetical protein